MKKTKKVLGVLMGVTMFLSLIAGDVYAESPVEELGEKQGDISDTIITETANSADSQDILERETDVSCVATGQYADWKNNAITYPAAGQLVAAGFISVKFAPLDGAVRYQVYLDDELIETIEDSNGETTEYQVEFRNREVKGHTVYVVATLESGAEITSNIRTFYVSKKGIGMNNEMIESVGESMLDRLNLSWYYNWSPNKCPKVDDHVEFVPLIWGRGSEDWLETGDWRNYRYLLTFNEPDRSDQADMTQKEVVERWEKIQPIVEEPTIEVSSPAMSNAFGFMNGWYGDYAKLMAEADYYDEFIAVHFYFDWPGVYILDSLEEIHEATGKPIWITEWAAACGDNGIVWGGGPDEDNKRREDVVSFMKDILPMLDELDYIERYAWFPFDGEDMNNGASGLYFKYGGTNMEKGALTSVGKVYQQYGNPEGWDPENPTQDVVVADKEASNVTLNKQNLTLEIGGSEKLEATVLPENAVDKSVTWTSLESSVASVTADGTVTGLKAGTAVIQVKTASGGYTADCTVTVKESALGNTPDSGDTFSSAKLSYKLVKSSDGTLTAQVTGPEVKTQTTITIPATVKYNNQEFKVTAIAKNAFKKNTKLKSVTIGANVTSIGNQAFYGCKKLTSVTIGKKVKTIGTKAFYQCSKLKKVTFKGAAVKKIGSKAFVGTNKKITFKAGSKKNVTKYKKLLKKKMPSTAKITK